jgi:ubiquinone/menaquinone biosynthesis C-methylase UbiE
VETGKNFDFYPSEAKITAIDFSKKMLKIAQSSMHKKNIEVELDLMDVQTLSYADNCFDTIVAFFVFSSVAKPIKGLKELYRVCKPGGQI